MWYVHSMHYLYLGFRFFRTENKSYHTQKGCEHRAQHPWKGLCLSNNFDQKLFLQLQYYYPYHVQWNKPLFVTWLLKYEIPIKPNDIFKKKAAMSTLLFLLMRKTCCLKVSCDLFFGKVIWLGLFSEIIPCKELDLRDSVYYSYFILPIK